MNDRCISFNLDNNKIRGRIVRLDKTLTDIFSRMEYPDNVAAAVAETSALGAMLASLMKFAGVFTLQIQSEGPISVLVADINSNGKLRACAKYDAAKMAAAQLLRKTDGEIEPTPHWLGKGNLIFTIDQGKNTELYQGIVDLKGKTLADCALRYFKNSEQIDTCLRLFVRKKENVWQSAGILIQKMPDNGGNIVEKTDDNTNEIWHEDKILTDSLQEGEIFDNNLPLEDVLYRLFHEHQVRVVKESKYIFGCRCSRDKLLNTLATMSKEDIEHMAENGKITATCNFCGTKYAFDKGELLKN